MTTTNQRRARLLLALIALVLALCAFAATSGGAIALADDPTVGQGQELVSGSAVDDVAGFGINDFKRLNKGTGRSYDGRDWGYRFQVNDRSAFVVVATEQRVLVFIPQACAEAASVDPASAGFREPFMRLVDGLDQAASNGGTLVGSLDVPTEFVVGENVFEAEGVLVSRDVEIGDGRLYVTIERTDGGQDKDGVVCVDYGHLVATEHVSVQEVPTWYESLGSFLASIDYRPLFVSLRTSFTALAIVFVLGLLAAWKSIGVKSRWKGLVDTLFTIPMVLPPTVCGFLLLLLFGNATPFGRWLLEHGVKLVFSWPATVIAAIVVAFPLMYRTARGAFEALDTNMLDAARTLGWSEGRIFARLMVPLAWPSIAAGTVLAFARAMGEFGATLFCAGNYAGVTQTMPIAIYFQWMGGNTDVALFWVVVVILLSFMVILVINLYSAHSQRYRMGGLTRRERRLMREEGQAVAPGSADDQSFTEIGADDVRSMLEGRD